MAKRKQNQPQVSGEVVRNAGILLIVLLSLFFCMRGVGLSLTRSSLFAVRDIVIAKNLGTINLPELEKLKGTNIFQVDLDKVSARVRAKYPQFANLEVLRKFPNQIAILAEKRDPFALVVFDLHSYAIDKNGYLIAPQVNGQEGELLTVIKGLDRQRPLSGDVVRDAKVSLALRIISIFRQDPLLTAVPLKSVNIEDTTRIICVLGDDAGSFEVMMDKDGFSSHLGMLGTLLSHRGVDLTTVKYIDLRFSEPIIGQKKTKKR